jgi:hypothetical protein
VGYFLSFGLLWFGYALLDWGHYIVKHEPVSLWWLMSGLGTRLGNAATYTQNMTPGIPAVCHGLTGQALLDCMAKNTPGGYQVTGPKGIFG